MAKLKSMNNFIFNLLLLNFIELSPIKKEIIIINA